MAEGNWRRANPWDGLLQPGRLGRTTGAAGISVTPVVDLEVIGIAAARGGEAPMDERLRPILGIGLPDAPGLRRGPDVDVLWASEAAWTLMSAGSFGLDRRLADLDLSIDPVLQSDARGILRLHGPKVREILARGCPIDLHPRTFVPGNAATTTISHIAVQLWQLDDAPTYELSVARSFARDFWEWLAGVASFDGIDVQASAGRSPS